MRTPRPRTASDIAAGAATILVPIKMRPDLRKRFRVRAVERDMTYAQLIESWLDEEDRKLERARQRQAHPFHRPSPEAAAL
ncbi:ribbon-helix-helix DNA binding domain protein [Mycobacterium phage Quesadilla]|uniref:Ribbon-helix-helix DNA binding domain protein n=1 Tax=Mycobacterium phage Quesadilla TaxID=2664226 RepID=A0A5Q2WEK5_9CAUD|nr:ribbon-helix-helix DNA binding domain protein [Mycobacterium phage Quesadilla]QGH75314.1 ribbon-helix-helix DNA binding domain protein [Mycobacterium phage Quesadilla]